MGGGNKKINERKRKHNNGNKRTNANNKNRTYIKPDHKVTVKHLTTFEDNNIANGYFDSYSIIKPINILSTSSWSHLLNIYESVRITKINIKVFLNSVSMSTPGTIAGMIYRDVLTSVPQRYAEQLIVEPGSKKARPHVCFNFSWKPIEPSDYEFYDHSQFSDMDNKKYGQINFAGFGLPQNFGKPLVEFIVHYDFKHLVKPESVPSLRFLHDNSASLPSQLTVLSNQAIETKHDDFTLMNANTESSSITGVPPSASSANSSLFSRFNVFSSTA